MARCGCGGGSCNCVVSAGENVTVEGSGSTALPYVISSRVTCDQVRPCISAGPGATYDPATGVVGADVSGDAGNNLRVNPDGSLFVPTGAATVTAGCGLTGDGSGSAPLEVATGAWPYSCPPETYGGAIVCGADGTLYGEPRGQVSFTSHTESRAYPDLPVPAGVGGETVDTFTTTVVNPDPCREALLLVEREVDVDFDIPAGGGAGYGHDTDEMYFMRNTGSSTMVDVHTQTTKLYRHSVVPPGGTATVNLPVMVSRGSGGATYNRIQVFIRCMLISL